MQPLTKVREVSSEGVAETTRFGISFKDQAHIKMLLRDAIYSDKELAVLREYSANAWDAHRMVGNASILEQSLDLSDRVAHQPRVWGDRSAHPQHAGVHMILLEPGRIQLTVLHG